MLRYVLQLVVAYGQKIGGKQTFAQSLHVHPLMTKLTSRRRRKYNFGLAHERSARCVSREILNFTLAACII